jgi:phosphate:Na+ symporter
MGMIAGILGGIGLFLLGMSLMTDGLKTLGGGSLRRILAKLTGGPLKAFATGTAITALIHSSAATVVTSIGFVSAGLLTFHQAIAIIFGANLGTTSTGWLVAALGLNFSIQSLALPFIALGAFLKLFSGERLSPAGLAIAGLGLVFISIDFLQQGFDSIAADTFDYAGLPADSLQTRLILVVSGMFATIILQSSSVAVALTITALHSGSISFDQAAALVIGQNVGTAATSLIAVIGATVPAKRTAIAHIGFNFVTGLAIFILFPFFNSAVLLLCDLFGIEQAGMQLAMYHTAFNVAGVATLLPLSGLFAKYIERLVPEDGPDLTRHLDVSVASIPAVAVDAARRTLVEVYVKIVEMMEGAMKPDFSRREIINEAESLRRSVEETRNFIANVRTVPDRTAAYHQHMNVLLAIDHIDSILIRKLENVPFKRLESLPELQPVNADMRRHLATLKTLGPHRFDADTATDVEAFSHHVAEERRQKRLLLIQMAAAGQIEADAAQELIEDLRWVDSLFFHLWKVRAHLSEA